MNTDYTELPSHVRVAVGYDQVSSTGRDALEHTLNKIVEEEMRVGYLLFKQSCALAMDADAGRLVSFITLAFRKMDPHEAKLRSGKQGVLP